MSDSETYADRIAEILVTGSVVRIDVGSYDVQPGQTGAPELVVRQRIVMPMEGFLQSTGIMVEVARKLEEKGVISRRPNEGEAPPPAGGPTG